MEGGVVSMSTEDYIPPCFCLFHGSGPLCLFSLSSYVVLFFFLKTIYLFPPSEAGPTFFIFPPHEPLTARVSLLKLQLVFLTGACPSPKRTSNLTHLFAAAASSSANKTKKKTPPATSFSPFTGLSRPPAGRSADLDPEEKAPSKRRYSSAAR